MEDGGGMAAKVSCNICVSISTTSVSSDPPPGLPLNPHLFFTLCFTRPALILCLASALKVHCVSFIISAFMLLSPTRLLFSVFIQTHLFTITTSFTFVKDLYICVIYIMTQIGNRDSNGPRDCDITSIHQRAVKLWK